MDVALRSFMAYCRSPHLHLCYMPESLYHQQSRKPRAHQVRQTWSFPRNGLACTTKQGGTAAEIDCCIMSVSNRTAEMERHQKKCEKKTVRLTTWGGEGHWKRTDQKTRRGSLKSYLETFHDIHGFSCLGQLKRH